MVEYVSNELRVFLKDIAKQLKGTESATGKRVKKPSQDGYVLEWVPEPPDKNGLSAVRFINVRVQYWRELGSILECIANGEDARRLFGQHERTKPKKDGEHRLRALAYWSVRARDPVADDVDALELARTIVPTGRALTVATVRKYAQRHRLRCLLLLSCSAVWVLKFQSTNIEIRVLGENIGPLMRYLRRKEDRERWRKPPHFGGMHDVLYYTPRRANGSLGIPEPAFPGMTISIEWTNAEQK